ncbi:MAG: hypothetical protein ACYDCK_11215 [Thermoplasmatota archaeon]
MARTSKTSREAPVAPEPRGFLAANATFGLLAAAILVLAVLARAPLALESDAVHTGHPDANVYFNAAYAAYLKGHFLPLPHGGSGWPLALTIYYKVLGVAPGNFSDPKGGEPAAALDAEVLGYAFSGALSAGAVVCTFLLARELVPRREQLLAMGLVAFDPYLLSQTGSLLTEAGYIVLFTLATWLVLRARRPDASGKLARGSIAAAALLMVAASAFRANGMVMAVMLAVWLWILLREDRERAKRAVVLYVVVFLVATAPYWAWRASSFGNPFDYGANSRLWADDIWNMSAPWWHGAPKETFSDYWATHTLGQMATRAWESVAWQVWDFFLVALTPFMALLSLGGAYRVRKRRAWSFAWLAAAFTFVTFLWMYPVVRTARYYTPLTPLLAPLAAFALSALAARTHRFVWPAIVALMAALYAIPALVPIARLGVDVAAHPAAAGVLAVFALVWLATLLIVARRGASRADGEIGRSF